MFVRQLIFLALFSASATSLACTAFCFVGDEKTSPLVGKSYDWDLEDALVMTNLSGMAKTAHILPHLSRPEDKPAEWISKYGSLTFNQYGREFPVGGINTEGLTVEALWLDSSRDEASDTRRTVNELQWIQYQLDNFATVEQLIEHLRDVRIARIYAAVHYFACDATGDCAVIEFLGRSPVVAHRESLPTPVLANGIYAREIEDLDLAELSKSKKTLGRFRTTARTVYNSPKQATVEDAFRTLSDVFLPGFMGTQWNIVYETAKRRVNFFTRTQRSRKMVSLSSFAFDCRDKTAAPKVLSLVTAGADNLAESFVDYTSQVNGQQVSKAYKALRLPQMVIDSAIAYPDSLRCR